MDWLFLVVSFVAVFAAGMMLTRQNAVHSALFLIVNFGCVAFLYLMLDAPFLAMVQVTVYTGAIMVLFLFVIMLLGAEATTDSGGRMRWLGFASAGIAVLILLIFGFPIASNMLGDESVDNPDAAAQLRVINAVPSETGAVFGVIEPGVDYTVLDNTPLNESVSISVTLESATDGAQTLSFSDVVYDDKRETLRDYSQMAAGEYTLTAALSDGATVTLPIVQETRQFADGDALSLLLHQDAESRLQLVILQDDISEPDVGKMRLTLINAVHDRQVSLVDIGQYTARRNLCDDSSCGALIPHRRLIDSLPLGESVSIELEEGEYNLAFVDTEQNILRALANYTAERGTVETRVLLREPGLPGNESSYRAIAFEALAKPAFGSPEAIGTALFIDYVLPVQLVGILLLVALIGVIVLARPDALRQAERRRVNQRRRVNRPLVSVIAQQTGADVLSGDYAPKLTGGSDDPAVE